MSQAHESSSESFSLPLPIYKSIEIGSIQSKEGEFKIFIGADKAVVADLKEKSLDASDTDLQANTSDYKRFGEGSYDQWYSKNRTPFALVHAPTGKLAAFAWLGPKPLGRKSLKYLTEEEQKNELEQKEDVWHTLVYRSYAPFRGKGLMGAFVEFCLQKYKEHFPDAKFWVGMNAANTGSSRLAQKLGFTRREEFFDAEKNWIAMTKE
jgi:RimJ/RimL family protein N-acetyltransferase